MFYEKELGVEIMLPTKSKIFFVINKDKILTLFYNKIVIK